MEKNILETLSCENKLFINDLWINEDFYLKKYRYLPFQVPRRIVALQRFLQLYGSKPEIPTQQRRRSRSKFLLLPCLWDKGRPCETFKGILHDADSGDNRHCNGVYCFEQAASIQSLRWNLQRWSLRPLRMGLWTRGGSRTCCKIPSRIQTFCSFWGSCENALFEVG